MAAASVGVTAEPEIMVFENLSPNDKILVLASDGIWDRLSNEEVMMVIAKQYYPTRDAEGAANYLMNEAVDRWQTEQGMVDDITIIIAFLNVGKGGTLGAPAQASGSAAAAQPLGLVQQG